LSVNRRLFVLRLSIQNLQRQNGNRNSKLVYETTQETPSSMNAELHVRSPNVIIMLGRPGQEGHLTLTPSLKFGAEVRNCIWRFCVVS